MTESGEVSGTQIQVEAQLSAEVGAICPPVRLFLRTWRRPMDASHTGRKVAEESAGPRIPLHCKFVIPCFLSKLFVARASRPRYDFGCGRRPRCGTPCDAVPKISPRRESGAQLFATFCLTNASTYGSLLGCRKRAPAGGRGKATPKGPGKGEKGAENEKRC
jgi:hypothetical protein